MHRRSYDGGMTPLCNAVVDTVERRIGALAKQAEVIEEELSVINAEKRTCLHRDILLTGCE